jgi:hypothetical protein
MITDQPRATEERQRTTGVREVTRDLLRAWGVATVLGNVGSTEETVPKDFPEPCG